VKKGERAGLVGVNGAGKTTQLQVVTGALLPDSGEVIRARQQMKIALLQQEFDVEPTRTVREELLSAFSDQIHLIKRQEEVQKGLEECGDDMDKMGKLLDELNELTSKAADLDVNLLDKKVDIVMGEIGLNPETDSDRLVASFSGGWQMRYVDFYSLRFPTLVRCRRSAHPHAIRSTPGCALAKSCSKNLISSFLTSPPITWT